MEIKGFSRYEVFPDGNVFSKISNKFLSCNLKNKNRYKNLILLDDENVQRNVHIHVLVAKHFVSGWFEGAVVNHKDGNKHNNRCENLEWVSFSDNNTHAYTFGMKTPVKRFKCFCGESTYDSIEELAKSENITKGCAWYRVRKGLTKDDKTYGLQ